ncbi:hypothetical protein [Entomohabitans teleogrylli]|uniref:hypothetical protein n=1 Tax=Entomohabitans teleogrylli TaxID=1384589 RepID=UPI000A7285ED|nr:hypothetical protein [Entomohabitans teleogrylli]
MSKKAPHKKKKAVVPPAAVEISVSQNPANPGEFGYNDMLGELEAIVAEAQVRLAEEEATA